MLYLTTIPLQVPERSIIFQNCYLQGDLALSPFLILVIWVQISAVVGSQCNECFFEVSNWLIVALVCTVAILTMESWSDYFLLIYLFEVLNASSV